MGFSGVMGRGVFWQARILTWVSPYFVDFSREVSDSESWEVWGVGSVLCLHCDKFGHSFSPIVSSVFPTSVFYGSFWSAVRRGWTFHVGFNFGHGLSPISVVLF